MRRVRCIRPDLLVLSARGAIAVSEDIECVIANLIVQTEPFEAPKSILLSADGQV